MARIVQKYGGTSVGDIDRIKRVAQRIKEWRDQGNELVVVVSARAGVTNELIAKAKASNDERQRMAYLHEAEQLLFDDCVIIPLYYTTQPYVAQPYIKGYHWSPLGLVDFKKAYIDETERK